MRRLLAAALFVAALSTAAGAQQPSAADPMYTRLRNGALTTSARTVGVTPRPGETRVFGVVIDIDIGGGTATVTSYASGDASLYLSNGGGTIGGIGPTEAIEAGSDAFSTLFAGAQAVISSFRETETERPRRH